MKVKAGLKIDAVVDKLIWQVRRRDHTWRLPDRAAWQVRYWLGVALAHLAQGSGRRLVAIGMIVV